jgi:hypothetical protein
VDFCTFVDGVCVACSAPHILSKQVCGVWRTFTPTPPTHGPGTELSKLLKRFGIDPTPTCQCREMSQKMDMWGPDECERPERIDEVVAVMRAEAEARGLPFLDLAGRMLVRRAIANARRNA